MSTDIVFATATLPAGFLGEAYEAGIAYSGAASALSAASASGLPTGLSLVHTTFAESCAVRITGTPTETGSYSVTVTLTDTAGAVTSSALTLNVYAARNDYGFVTNVSASELVAQEDFTG